MTLLALRQSRGRTLALCDVCGATVLIRGSVPEPKAIEEATAAHELVPDHARAVTEERFRHRDDTPHSMQGPLGCFVCASIRTASRELVAKTNAMNERLARESK